jgi:hypothetical protein
MALMHGIGDRVNRAGMLSPQLLARFDALSAAFGLEQRTFTVIAPKLCTTGSARAPAPASRKRIRVKHGVEHRPVAREEVHLMLIEPTGTPNTGDKATAAARKLA